MQQNTQNKKPSNKNMRTFKFKLYHDKKNKTLLKIMHAQCEVYNVVLKYYRDTYESEHKIPSAFTAAKYIRDLKNTEQYAHWNELNSQSIEYIATKIDGSYKSCFALLRNNKNKSTKINAKFPDYKDESEYNSFTLRQNGYKLLEGNKIKILGKVYRYFKHRDIEGVIKTITISRDRCGDFWISFSCDLCQSIESIVEKTLSNPTKFVGFDMGIKDNEHFLIASDGNDIAMEMCKRENIEKLKELKEAMFNKDKDTVAYKRIKQQRAKLERHIANKRADMQWKIAHDLVQKYDVICLEDLDISSMIRKTDEHRFGSKLADLSFSSFKNKLDQEAKKFGKHIIYVDRYFPSTQICSNCGNKNEELKNNLSIREWVCPVCGVKHDRDINAAKNIRNEGIKMFYGSAEEGQKFVDQEKLTA